MSQVHNSRGEVLVVEDTPASLKLLTGLLTQAGYTVRQAPDGELALWSAGSRPPELILLDVRMPGIDGFEVCRRLKQSEALRNIPVIFLSAQYDTDDKVRGFEAGAVDFIGKPYQSEEVLARTQVHINLARTRDALAASNDELTLTLAQLRSARAEVQRQDRLAALGAMVNGVAHELNTPIGNSVLAASLLAERTREFAAALERGMKRSDLERYVCDATNASDILMRNLDKSAELVTSFKQVASDQANSQRRCFDLGELVADMAVALNPSLRDTGVHLELDVAAGLAMDTYPGALCQIISQLVLNAVHHGFAAGATGTIRCDARSDASGSVMLRVCDNGAGIAPAHLDKVFDPFFTTRLGQGSSGLGLNIAHNLVGNVLGGTISATSEPGHTCFTLRLPCAAPELATEPKDQHAA